MRWFFSYGISTSPERFEAEMGPVEEFCAAEISDHALIFQGFKEHWGGGTSCIVPVAGRRSIGTAYKISESQWDRLGEVAARDGYAWFEKTASCATGPREVGVLLPEIVGDPHAPAVSYVARIREGLSYLFGMLEVDAYLREALGRDFVFPEMVGRWQADAEFPEEYGIGFRRLMPVPGLVRAPWGGAIGRLAPGDETALYTHDEEEVALVLRGRGTLRVNDQTRHVEPGDFVYFEPDCEHVVTNADASSDLEVLFIWWGGSCGALWAGRRV